MSEKIIDTFVKKLRSPTQGNRITYDSEVKGFGVRVTAKGAKAFILNYRAGGVEKRITIGSYPDWSVAAARDHAKMLKRQIDMGSDPLRDRKDYLQSPTIQDLWERYEKEHLPNLSERGQKDTKSMFTTYILPELRNAKVAELRHDEVAKLHRNISQTRPIRANRVIEVLSKAFSLARKNWEWRKDNPCEGVRTNPENQRTRYYSADEIKRIHDALDAHKETTSANAIKLLLYTGARRGEALTATWDQFDLENGLWIKPSSHTKQRREHRVRLNALAIDALKSIKRSSKYVFPGKNGKPLTDVKKTWATVCKNAQLSDARLHDLRHTFASILITHGETLEVTGQMLGHTQAQTTKRYAHLMDEHKQIAANKVGNIISLAKAGKS